MMFNNVLHRNETSFGHTKFNLLKSQKLHFSKGVNPRFWLFFFSLFVFGQNNTTNNVYNNVLDRRETFSNPKNIIFPKELTDAFGQK